MYLSCSAAVLSLALFSPMTLPDRIAASCFTGAEYPQGLHIEPCSFAEWHAHDAYCDCMSALLWPAVFELQRCRAVIALSSPDTYI